MPAFKIMIYRKKMYEIYNYNVFRLRRLGSRALDTININYINNCF